MTGIKATRRRRRPAGRKLVAGLAAMLVAVAIAACGEAGSSGGGAPAPPQPDLADFPKPKKGGTLDDLRREMRASELVLAPSVSVLESGRKNRFGYGLFDSEQRQVTDASMALYVAPAGGGEVSGPYPARYESLVVEPQFESEGTASDPHSARTVYVAELPFERPGRYEVLGAVSLEDRLIATSSAQPSVEVVRDSPVPEVGEPAPRISTPTVADVGGAIEEIDTRVPPVPEVHDVDFADVVGEKPVVLLFATPALCQSRVCGPVADVMLQVRAAREGKDVAFIHMEIFQDNQLEAGFRPQVRAFNLPTEPWLFTVDREGEVAARLEGAFSARELEQAIDAATGA